MANPDTMVNSYDAGGHQPFIHDPNRGKWNGRWDFFFAHLPNVFGIRSFLIFATYLHYFGAGYIIIPVLLSTFLYVIPVFFVQSFLGQFSSTGFISVFRISPLFKGVGYVILALNFMSSIYSSSVATFPLLFLLKSFQLNATWMHCGNSWNTENCSTRIGINESAYFPSQDDDNITDSMEPQYEFFYREVLKMTSGLDTFDISWTGILGQFVIWVLVWLLIFPGISCLSKFLRYSALICSLLVTIIFIRISFLPEAGEDTVKLFTIEHVGRISYPLLWILSPTMAATILGRGWGTTLTMASFQQFKTNTERYSFVIPLVLTMLMGLIGYMVTLMNGFISRRSLASLYYSSHDLHEYAFAAIPYFCGHLEAAPIWSIIFFLMFFLAELSLLVVQTFATLTALTDEHVKLRERRLELTAGLCAISFLLSISFETKHFESLLKRLKSASYANQMLICFVELMIVVWIYGRTRFIRDVRFMLVRNFAAWKFYVIRYVTPIFIILTFLIHLSNTISILYYLPTFLKIFLALFKITPWLLIPGYIAFKLMKSIGTLSERVRKSVQPNDWYPANPTDKLKYELALGASDISQQLLEMNENNDG